ncbi:MAG: DNA mismatch repair protein MutS [Rikenellaceae bacterium]
MSVEIENRYKKAIESKSQEYNKIKKVGNIYLLLKLLFFSLLMVLLYYFFVKVVSIIFPIAALLAYILTMVLDSKRDHKELEIKCLLGCLETEFNSLNGDFTGLDSGKRYVDGTHDYSFDLDVFGENSLFLEMNRTVTEQGADELARMLENPILDCSLIVKRQQSIEEFSQNIDWTHRFRVLGKIYPVKRFDNELVSKWRESDYSKFTKFKPLLYILNATTLLSLIALIFGLLPFAVFSLFSTIQLIIWLLQAKYITKVHGDINKFIKCVSNNFYLIDHFLSQEFNSEELVSIKNQLSSPKNAQLGFKELRNIQENLDRRSNAIMLFILNALYLNDSHLMLKIAAWKECYIDSVESCLYSVSKIDALISMANYRYNHPDFCEPKLSENRLILAKEMVHPLIKGDNVVGNDIEIKKDNNIFIVTGANMSGKSTFLRCVGLNYLLAMTGNVVRAENFEFLPISLFTSMRTNDNLSSGTSYFLSELLRLKQLHEKAAKNGELFVILDEMLKGTNSADKLSGSRQFLIKLLTLKVSGLVATHDLKLGELKDLYPQNFENICFEIEHSGDELVYTYKLQKGVSKNMNATFLLQKMELI